MQFAISHVGSAETFLLHRKLIVPEKTVSAHPPRHTVLLPKHYGVDVMLWWDSVLQQRQGSWSEMPSEWMEIKTRQSLKDSLQDVAMRVGERVIFQPDSNPSHVHVFECSSQSLTELRHLFPKKNGQK